MVGMTKVKSLKEADPIFAIPFLYHYSNFVLTEFFLLSMSLS